MPNLTMLLNEAVSWLYLHLPFTQGQPLLLAALVAAGGWVAFKLAPRVLGWVWQAAVIAATVMICARLVGVGL